MRVSASFAALVLIGVAIGDRFAHGVSSGDSDEYFLGQNSGGDLSWGNDELTRPRQLRSAQDLLDRDAFLTSSSLASFLGYSKVDTVHLPIPLTFVFVGFEGDGNGKLSITDQELQAWLWHVDHVLPHVRVQLSELSCAEDGHCSGLGMGSMKVEKASPVHSYVHLNFTCELIGIKRTVVSSAFEQAIYTFSRPVDPEQPKGAQQVDAAKMEEFIDSFISALGLEKAYTFVVLNPAVVGASQEYGYRRGVSHPEISKILETLSREQLLNAMLAQRQVQEPKISNYASGSGWAGWVKGEKRAKFDLKRRGDASALWAAIADKYLKDDLAFQAGMRENAPVAASAKALVQALRVAIYGTGPLASVLKTQLFAAEVHAEMIFSKFATMHPAEDCLVSNWVGKGRWLLLDLTAAASGHEWGPAMGGDGVVHKGAVPLVAEHLKQLERARESVREYQRPRDPHHRAMLQGRQEHLSKELQAHYQEHLAERERQRVNFDPTEPGAQPYDLKEEVKKWNLAQREHLAKAEIDFLTRFAGIHCSGRTQPPSSCLDVRADVQKQRELLATFAANGEATYNPFPEHKYDIFGNIHNVELESGEVFDEALRSQDLFMAELAALLSRAVRHVVAPPTAAWRHDSKLGQTHDTATPFSKELNFRIYILTESIREKDAENKNRPGIQPFNAAQFMEKVSTLKIGKQKISHSVVEAILHDDYNMATAVAVSHRTHNIDFGAHEDFGNESTERQYLDSRELAHHFRCQPFMRTMAHTSKAIDIPVIVIQLDRDSSVLLDEHYNARAMEDMIIVVTNSANNDEVPTGMSCNDALVARPLSPMKEALAVTLTYLGGVLSSHLGYDPRRKQVTHDWLWSVGSHPMSFTSTGLDYTSIQRDSLARSYLLDALDSSIEIVNRGIRTLEVARTTHHLHKHMLKSKSHVQALKDVFESITDTWRVMAHDGGELNFDDAVRHITTLQAESKVFLDLCTDLATAVEHLHCTGHQKDDRSPATFPILILSATVAVAAVLYVLSGIQLTGGTGRHSSKKGGFIGA